MDEIITIFTESNEDLGLQINSYAPILTSVNGFLDDIDKCVGELNSGKEKFSIDLSSKISSFKNDTKKKITPEAIEIGNVGSYKKKVKSFQSELDKALIRFSKIKDKVSYGGNYIRAIIKKPAVYQKDIDAEKYENVNGNIRAVNRALDWTEKIMLDLFNLADQDMNILTLIDKVYRKNHIYESTMTESDVDIVQMLPEARLVTSNSQDKKTSSIPPYIKNNHDMATYGEEEPKEDDEKEKTLDDYRRPSADKEDDEEDIKPFDGDSETPAAKSTPSEEDRRAIQNYYYYTYNNSLNKTSKDDHSVHSKDDHSVNNSYNNRDDDDERKEHKRDLKSFHAVESANPWELNLDIPSPIMERGFGHFGNFENPERRIENPTRFAKSKLVQLAAKTPRYLTDEELDEPLAKNIDTKKIFADLFADDYKTEGFGDDEMARLRGEYQDLVIKRDNLSKQLATVIEFPTPNRNNDAEERNNLSEQLSAVDADLIKKYKEIRDLRLKAVGEEVQTESVSKEDVVHHIMETLDKDVNDLGDIGAKAAMSVSDHFREACFWYDCDYGFDYDSQDPDVPYYATIAAMGNYDYEIDEESDSLMDEMKADVDKFVSLITAAIKAKFGGRYIVSVEDEDRVMNGDQYFEAIKKYIEQYGHGHVSNGLNINIIPTKEYIASISPDDNTVANAKTAKLRKIISGLVKWMNNPNEKENSMLAMYYLFPLCKIIGMSQEELDRRIASKLDESKFKPQLLGRYFSDPEWGQEDFNEEFGPCIILAESGDADDFVFSTKKKTLRDVNYEHNDIYGVDEHDYTDGFYSFAKSSEAEAELNDQIRSIYNELSKNPAMLESVITESAQTARGRSEYDELTKMIGKKPSPQDLTVPSTVTINFDSGARSGDAAEFMSQIFKNIRIANVFTDDGNYVKDDTAFDEVPIAAYYLHDLIGTDNSFNALFDANIQTDLADYIKREADEQGATYDELKPSSECPFDPIPLFKKFNLKADAIFLKPEGKIGFAFDYDLDPEHGIGIEYDPRSMEVSRMGQSDVSFESVMTEEVGDADDMKPKSDHPIRDALMDLDRATTKTQQKAKKAVQDIQNAGRAAMKPVNRTKQWIGNMISKWKDADETNIKEKLADPNSRKNLFNAIKTGIEAGALLKAGILLNPVFLFLAVTRKISKNKKEYRLRNEMIGELKTEMEIIQEKIQDADRKGDNKAKYELMRFKNELNKKLLRVSGTDRWRKVI